VDVHQELTYDAVSVTPSDTGHPGSTAMATDSEAPTPRSIGGRRLFGVASSPGRVVGPVAHFPEPPGLPDCSCSDQPDQEIVRLTRSLAAVAGRLAALASGASGVAADILAAQVMIVEDEDLLATAAERVREGRLVAEHALAGALDEYGRLLRAQGGYLAERADDLCDIRDRVVADLQGIELAFELPDHPCVLVARNLAPADTARTDPARVLAFVIEGGGPTCHTAIVARSLGIPAVVGCAGATELPPGVEVLVDGGRGEVLCTPTEEEAACASHHRPAPPAPLDASAGTMADGTRIALLANVGSVEDAIRASAAGAQGVGLLRTELLFLDRTEAPGLEEQAALYADVFAAFPERPVVVRTLDAGADKPLPFLGLGAEENPALGCRGVRVSRRRPEVLETQLQAIAMAVQSSRAQVSVMAPMIATVAEMQAFAEAADRAGVARRGIKVGMMVEVPAAAVLAGALFQVADFASIGTNDLAQYTMAADRCMGELAELHDPWQPALLHLIAIAAGAGVSAGRTVGVCGEAASDPALVAVLVGLGVHHFSMAPRSLAAVDEQLRSLTVTDCEGLAETALAEVSAVGARVAVHDWLGRR
jgi:phosphoenolpyruvate-protein phosphotransferase